MSYHKLPPLPYAMDALEPHISRETLEYHHGKHHQSYVDKLNELVLGTPYEKYPLEAIVVEARGPIFDYAAQVWNHTFYWECLIPGGETQPEGALGKAINDSFGSFTAFKDKFATAANGVFGSGWAWLVRVVDGSLVIWTTANAQTPLAMGGTPLLTCDLWEHAYYIDHRNDRAAYLKAFWALANWKFAARNYMPQPISDAAGN